MPPMHETADPRVPAQHDVDLAARKAADPLLSIPVTLEIVFARARMPAGRVLALAAGETMPLGHPAGAEVEIHANGRRIAFGTLFLESELTREVGVRVTRLAIDE
jgi:flagellar motor switch/type III secretory pathway protein FliN